MALIDKASLLMVPSTYEAGKLYNVLPSGNRAPDSTDQNSGYDQTRADFDFDRGSNASATRIGSDGLIKKYRENLLTYSNDFSNADWVKSGASVTGGKLGYDGSFNASLLKGNTSNTQHRIYHPTNTTSLNALSVYVKASGHNYIQILSGHTTNQYANFDLSDGSIGDYGVNFIPKIESVGNDWYRVSVFNNEDLVYLYVQLVSSKTAVWNESWAMPNDTDGVLIQNAQVEKGLVATDYLDSTDVTGKAGVLVDLPRINYDANGENGSLLLEPSRQNLVAYSEYFGGWNKSTSAITITQNYGISPEGVKNSSRVQFTGASQHINISTSLGVGVTSTGSVYIKGTAGETIQFDTGGAGALKTLTGDWQRIEVTSTSVSSLLLINTFNGATARDIEVYGAQVEPNASYPSSYIPTMGTSETRAADSCSVTGASDVIGQTEGTMFFELTTIANSQYKRLSLNNGSYTNSIVFDFQDNNVLIAKAFNGGIPILSISSSVAIADIRKIAIAYKNNDYAFYVNGSLMGTLTSIVVPSGLSAFGFDLAGNQKFEGNIKQALLFKERLTNAELATLTTL